VDESRPPCLDEPCKREPHEEIPWRGRVEDARIKDDDGMPPSLNTPG
jgi:hypothetical protein